MFFPSNKGGEEGETGTKFAKGGINDLSEGPVKKRGCTDIPCCIIFVVSIIFYLYCSFAGISDGNLNKLLNPRDYSGDYCGIKEQWRTNGTDLESFDNMIYTLNVTEAFNTAALKFVCSSVAKQQFIDGGLATQAELDQACAGAGASCSTWQECQDQAQSQFAKYFDVTQVAGMLYGSGGSSILSQMTKYFNQVCASSCSVTFAEANATGSAARDVTYVPPPTMPWSGIWNKAIAAGWDMSYFTFKALPSTSCPYPAQLCVPVPGIEYKELYRGYCTIKVDNAILTSLSDSVSSALGGVAGETVSQLSSGIDTAFGDFNTSIDTFILVALLALIVGLVFVILLRFFVKPVVWGAILLVFVLFLIGGYLLTYYSQMCEDGDITDAASQAGLITVSDGDACGGLYHHSDPTTRDVLLYSGYATFVLAAVWALAICCLFSRIKLAIAINEVAAVFVYQTPHIVLVPVLQYILAILWSALWLFLVAFLVSQVPDDFVPRGSYTYLEAYGTEDTAGVCASTPESKVFYNALAPDCTGSDPKCWECAPPRYMLDYRFWFSLLMFFWNNAFIVACGQCTIAGAVGIWFFTRDRAGIVKTSLTSVARATKNCFIYHLGSLAFGSFILAVVQTLKWFMQFMSKQAKAQKNKIMEVVAKIAYCCLWCFEKCVKFLNKNAYIQVALMGTNFCASARAAFFLILRNAARFGVLAGLGAVIHFIGKFFILVSTGVLGMLMIEGMHPEIESPYVLILIYCVVGYFAGALFMNVYGLAVDATLQCFIATEEMGILTDFIPEKLRVFIRNNEGDEKGGCCSCGF